MIGLVLVAHSPEVVSGLRAMVAQAAPSVPCAGAGGTATGVLGTSAPAVEAALRDVLARSEGAVVLLDLGSAALALEMALEALPAQERDRVVVSAGPLVEGAVLAAVEAASGALLASVAAAADNAASAPKLPGDR